VCRGEGVRRDKVMGDIRMHRPHDMDTYAGRSEPSKDTKESESTAYQETRSRR
jgi:hypothetical protein